MIKKIKNALKFYQKKLGLNDSEIKDPVINPLGNGENHLIYLATCRNNKKFVFRISFRKELESALKREFEVLKKLPKNLGPTPFIFDGTKKIIPNTYMIQSFVLGNKVKKWGKDLLKTHAQKIALLHSKNKTKKKEDLYKVFMARANFSKRNQPEILKDDNLIEGIFTKLEGIFLKNKLIFDNQKKSYLIHGDLHDGNILVENKNLHYVDWEEAKYGDNALDVASLLWFINLNKNEYETYLNAYKNILKDDTLEKRMLLWLLYKDFSLLLHKKWQSLDPKKRDIVLNENYEEIIKKIISRIEKRIGTFFAP